MTKIIKLPKTRHKEVYKYALNVQVNSLPRTVTINDLLLHLKKDGVTKNEFYSDRNILIDSKSSIPSDRLFIYAKVFDCPVADLLNHEIKAKSIRQQNMKLKTKLS